MSSTIASNLVNVVSSITTTTTEPEIVRLRAQVAQLTKANAVLLSKLGGTPPPPTTAVPTVLVHGVKVPEKTYEYGCLAGVVSVMVLLWVVPLLKPIRRHIESRLYKIYPIITIFNLIFLAVALAWLDFVDFNDLFFGFVKVLEFAIDYTQMVLFAVAGFVVLVLMWKFKDRILEALGVDNPQMLIGSFRDWATCWSMKRFAPIELFIWKVEGLPTLHLHQANDLYIEVCCGYNNTMRTRVHIRAGQACVMKESVQLNYDRFDKDTRLWISVKNQDILGASDVAAVQLGASQVGRLMEPDTLNPTQRTLGWGTTSGGEENGAWAESRFQSVDLLPAGQIYLRIQPVNDDDDGRPNYGKIGSTF